MPCIWMQSRFLADLVVKLSACIDVDMSPTTQQGLGCPAKVDQAQGMATCNS
jgi:hypothetical protein